MREPSSRGWWRQKDSAPFVPHPDTRVGTWPRHGQSENPILQATVISMGKQMTQGRLMRILPWAFLLQILRKKNYFWRGCWADTMGMMVGLGERRLPALPWCQVDTVWEAHQDRALMISFVTEWSQVCPLHFIVMLAMLVILVKGINRIYPIYCLGWFESLFVIYNLTLKFMSSYGIWYHDINIKMYIVFLSITYLYLV